MLLDQQQIDEFNTNGVVVIRSFYDIETEIKPVLKAIYDIIALIAKRAGLNIERQPFALDTFDSGFLQLIEFDRNLGGVIYDAVKQIPAFLRITSSEKHERLFKQIYMTDCAAVSHGGMGIRIDIPYENRYRAPWHQEYLNQLRSRQGVVFWAPLLDITQELGPVEFCLRSHEHGVFPVRMHDPNFPDKTGAYAMVIDNEQETVNRFIHSSPLLSRGDLGLAHWFVLHKSGINRSDRARWSMQMRYFNFEEITGIENNWQGSFAVGNDPSKIHPEYFVK